MKITCHGLDCDIRLSLPDREDWMHAAVAVKVPNFEGSFSCTIQVGEWKAFAQLLQQLESAIGSDTQLCWENTEGNIGFEFSLKRLGGLEGSYKFSSDNFSLGPVLSGTFTADQTFLGKWVKSAVEAVKDVR